MQHAEARTHHGHDDGRVRDLHTCGGRERRVDLDDDHRLRAERLVDEKGGELLEVATELRALGGLVAQAGEPLDDEWVVDDRDEHGAEPTGG